MKQTDISNATVNWGMFVWNASETKGMPTAACTVAYIFMDAA